MFGDDFAGVAIAYLCGSSTPEIGKKVLSAIREHVIALERKAGFPKPAKLKLKWSTSAQKRKRVTEVSMATRYDPTIIEQFADKLYEQADATVLVHSFLGFVLGSVPSAAFVLWWLVATRETSLTPVGGIFLCAATGCAFGFLIGRERAFTLRLQAQLALCQDRIERNTRRG